MSIHIEAMSKVTFVRPPMVIILDWAMAVGGCPTDAKALSHSTWFQCSHALVFCMFTNHINFSWPLGPVNGGSTLLDHLRRCHCRVSLNLCAVGISLLIYLFEVNVGRLKRTIRCAPRWIIVAAEIHTFYYWTLSLAGFSSAEILNEAWQSAKDHMWSGLD